MFKGAGWGGGQTACAYFPAEKRVSASSLTCYLYQQSENTEPDGEVLTVTSVLRSWRVQSPQRSRYKLVAEDFVIK